MTEHVIEREQVVPAPLEEVFEFFSRARNLEAINWEPGRMFVDRQTLVGDRVRYRLPFGRLGDLAHRAFVRRDLDRVFSFRREAVVRMLG